MGWFINALDKFLKWSHEIDRKSVPYEVWKDAPPGKMHEVQDEYLKAKRQHDKEIEEAKANAPYYRRSWCYHDDKN